MCAILLTLTKGAVFLSAGAALGLMIDFAALVVTIIFGILVLVLDNKNNCL